jgi:hypothetical protein
MVDTDRELQLFMTKLQKEGIKLKKQVESEILIEELTRLLNATAAEVSHGCFRVYSMETFLYRQLNQILREEDSTKVEVYGLFVRILYFSFDHSSLIEIHSIEVYRGMNLTSSMVDAYKKAMENSAACRWTGFISTSRNLTFAENFDTNTLLILKLKKLYKGIKKSIDIARYSQYPNEEEVLLKAGVDFTVQNIEYNRKKNKHYIHINVYV